MECCQDKDPKNPFLEEELRKNKYLKIGKKKNQSINDDNNRRG